MAVAFEEVLGGLVRAGLLRVTADTFEKEGRTIPFQRAWLTPEARTSSLAGLEFTLPEEAHTLAGSGPRRRGGKKQNERPSRPPTPADAGLVADLKK